EEAVARPERLHKDVGLHATRVADESRDRAHRFARVIRGDEVDLAIAKKVRTAVAEISDDGGHPGDRRRDERRGRTLLAAFSGRTKDGVVRAADRGGKRVRGGTV